MTMRTVIVGTAGHIDHGKSELVRALTGTHPDRLREERERGITIDIGFANLERPDLVLSFVDVPGHERFVKNMLAGASGIDLVLLVVAADESVRPQTREHFHICRLLGLSRGVIALSKIDLADPELAELAAAEVREFVAGSFLAEAEIVPVSARTGEGIPRLIEALERAAGTSAARDASAPARLPVDRSFAVRGFGTVVTGTLVAGTIRTGEELELLTAGRRVKVRGIETRGRAVPSVVAGQRTALNLHGVAHQEIARGDVLAEPGSLAPTSVFDAKISLLSDAPAPMRDLARVRLHAGTAEILARVRLLARSEMAPGEDGYAQFRLEKPAVLAPGDRFIFRRYSPPATIGGGVVLDAFPEKHRRADQGAARELARLTDADAAARAERLLAARGAAGLAPVELARRAGARWSELAERLAPALALGRVLVLGGAGGLAVSREGFEEVRGSARAILEEHHRKNPLRPGIGLEELRSRLVPGASPEGARALLAELERQGALRIERDLASLPDHRVALSAEESRLAEALSTIYRRASLAPPDAGEALAGLGAAGPRGEAVLAHLVREGALRRLRDGLIFHREALEDLRARIRDYRRRQDRIDVATFKELTGVSRKHAIPLLEYLDEERVTLRRGNERVILD